MNYHRLGKSALMVSEISMGCMSLSSDIKDSSRVIQKALDCGINFFDTADLYEHGENEKLLGSSLKKKRKEVIIATKVGNQWNAEGTSWNWNPKKDYIIAAAEESLKRLNTDYIDLYQLHGGTINDPIDETIEAFEILKKQGKIIEYGISSIRPNVIREYVRRSNITSVMMQYSLLDRRPEESCLDLLKQNGISVLTRGTVAKGYLAGKPVQPYLGHSDEEVNRAFISINKIADRNQRTPPQVACQYVLYHPAVATAVIGFRTINQLLKCVGYKKLPKMDEIDFSLLQESVKPYFYEKHR